MIDKEYESQTNVAFYLMILIIMIISGTFIYVGIKGGFS